MVIISVINSKGGCGKTTISTCLSGAYAKRGFKVLHIDADPQGGSTTAFNLGDGVSIDKSLSGVIQGSSSIDEVIVKTEFNGLRGIPSSKQMEEIGYLTKQLDEENYEKRLLQALMQVENSYDYIIIDSPNANSPIMQNVIYASDVFVVPFEGADAVARLADLQESLTLIRPDEDYLRIDVLNNVSDVSKKTTRRDILKEFDELEIPRPTFEIRTSSPLARNSKNGGSVCHVSNTSAGTQDILRLSHIIQQEIDEETQGIAKVGDPLLTDDEKKALKK